MVVQVYFTYFFNYALFSHISFAHFLTHIHTDTLIAQNPPPLFYFFSQLWNGLIASIPQMKSIISEKLFKNSAIVLSWANAAHINHLHQAVVFAHEKGLFGEMGGSFPACYGGVLPKLRSALQVSAWCRHCCMLLIRVLSRQYQQN